MRLRRGTGAGLALAVGATLVTAVVLVWIDELAANVRYYRWRARFDNGGWIGALAVASPNRELLWEYRPYGDSDGIATNRWGFREVDHPTPEKPPGVRRVAFLGDSVALGMGVEPEETSYPLLVPPGARRAARSD